MATPITSIEKQEPSQQEIQQEKLAELQASLAEQDQALNKMLEISGELDEIGLLDALQAMVEAREEIAKIAVDQVSCEPITHLINHLINISAAISSIDPDVTEKLATSVKTGLKEAESTDALKKVSVFQLMTALNDPDINRAVTFGLNFLKGIGKGLSPEQEK